MNLLVTSCVQEPEAPQIKLTESSQLAKVRSWFEENKTKLRLPDKGSKFRTESQELILPFFEKEPDWDKFHHYYFPDGREVFEVSLENATKYFPVSIIDSFPNKNPNNYVLQNIMFVKHPTENRFDPLIARYFPNNPDNYFDFQNINYNSINEFWEGRIDLFTYDEHHLISFEFLPDGEKRTISYGASSNSKFRTLSDCREITREITWVTPSPGSTVDDPLGLGATYHSKIITEVVCTGSMGEFPTTGTVYVDGTYYYNGDGFDPSGSGCGTCDYNPPPAPAPSLFIINGLDNPCTSDLFKKLAKGAPNLTDMTGISNLDIFPWMLELFRQGGKFNYYIEDVDLPVNAQGIRPNAQTKIPDSQGNITIQIDNSYANNATSLSLARTIIHETAHAYMIYLSKTNYEFRIELNNYYIAHNNSTPDANHGMMSQYLFGMAISLYNWDKNSGPTSGTLGLDYYYKMAFGGLLQNGTANPISDVVPMIPNGDWNTILQILENEATGNNMARGIKENCND
jgi:hypothetical protein